jgi:hypothetical protein
MPCIGERPTSGRSDSAANVGDRRLTSSPDAILATLAPSIFYLLGRFGF